MPENFDFLQDDKYEVGNVRNFLVSARVNSERKEYTAGFHAIFALVLSFLIYLAVDGAAIGVPALFTSLLIFVIPPLCVFTFLYAPLGHRLLPVILPLLLFGIRVTLFANGEDLALSFANLFIYLLCILCSTVLTKCVISGYTKSTVFVSLTVCYGLILICTIAYNFISQTGSFGFSETTNFVKAIFDNAANKAAELCETEQGFIQMKQLLYPEGEITKPQLIAGIHELFDYTFSLIKAFIPSIIAVSCMIYSFITIGIFTRVAGFFSIDVFVCITDIKWSYRPGMLTARIYDIVFFVYIFASFIALPAPISATVINLLIIMTPLMFVASVKCIYSVLLSKVHKPFAAGALMGGILFFAIMLLSISAFFVISFIGVSFLKARDREEKKIIPIKIINDMELCEKAFMNKTTRQSHNENSDETE